MEAPKANKSKPLSPALIGDLLRFFDVAVVLAMGVVIYLVYLGTPRFDITAQYLVSIFVAGLLASVLFDGFGVYAGDHALSRRHRIDRMLSAWAATFALLLAAAFALKISDFYSRVWATSWYFPPPAFWLWDDSCSTAGFSDGHRSGASPTARLSLEPGSKQRDSRRT